MTPEGEPIPLARCPMRDILDADPAVVTEVRRHEQFYYPLYKRGHLPTAGGAVDQPHKTMEYLMHMTAIEQRMTSVLLKQTAEGGAGDGSV